MSKLSKFFPSMLLFTAFCFSAAASQTLAAGFLNPALKTQGGGCSASNLQAGRFSAEIREDQRLKLCLALDKITFKLNANVWSAALSGELKAIWQVFSTEAVSLRLMPKDAPSGMLAMAQPFPSEILGGRFEAGVYLRPEKSDNDSFFQVFLHELRHVYDFYETWKNRTKLSVLEIERRAFLLNSKLAQETPERENFPVIPKLWKESWTELASGEISAKRAAAVDNYLQKSKVYRRLAGQENKNALDFSYLKAKSDNSPKNVRKDGARLPDRPTLPKTDAPIPQKIQESGFSLEKPKNPRDEKEILRVALSNEKKLYYGMSNFAYDQAMAFQCWRKGKVVSEFTENLTVARNDAGNTFLSSALPPAGQNFSQCLSNYQTLKTDFTETFWVSPALEKMPIVFSGFVKTDGQTLARYTVLRPEARLFNQLAAQYSSIKPFRVFVGTIFVSPEDGQIVKFWGASFPEDNVTNNDARRILGSYSVTALRQKLNIDRGVWVTVYIFASAVADLEKDARPFSYTVRFSNYRQTTTDVRVLDDDSDAIGSK